MGETRENVRRNLERLLSDSPMSQKAFAEKLGVSQSAVTNWVKGNNSPDIEVVAKICEVLGVSVLDLFKPPPADEVNETLQLSMDEQSLLDNYRSFNEEGRQKINSYVEDLAQTGRYIKTDTTGMGTRYA